jgi:ComEC/Rec2-related protein
LRYHIPQEEEKHMKTELRHLAFAAAAAVGIAAGTVSDGYGEIWPLAAIAALTASLFGFGYSLPGWHFFAFALVFTAVTLAGASGENQLSRERFWLKDRRSFRNREQQQDSLPYEIRKNLSRRAGIGLERSSQAADLNRAILLGERRRLPRSTRQAFIEAGTMHIFAISGLHVMIIAFLLRLLMRFTFVSARLAGPLSLPALWLYVAATGSPPSAVRAAAMASIHFSSSIFLRRPNATVSWSLTFLAVGLLSPGSIFEAGCLLSFAVTLAIILASRHLCNGGGFKSMLTVSAAAWIAGTPIAAHFFGRVTPGGFFANLLIMPMATLNVICGALGIITSFFSRWLALHLNNLSALVADNMKTLSFITAEIPFASWETRKWTVAECLMWYAAAFVLILAVRFFRSRRGWLYERTPPLNPDGSARTVRGRGERASRPRE